MTAGGGDLIVVAFILTRFESGFSQKIGDRGWGGWSCEANRATLQAAKTLRLQASFL